MTTERWEDEAFAYNWWGDADLQAASRTTRPGPPVCPEPPATEQVAQAAAQADEPAAAPNGVDGFSMTQVELESRMENRDGGA